MLLNIDSSKLCHDFLGYDLGGNDVGNCDVRSDENRASVFMSFVPIRMSVCMSIRNDGLFVCRFLLD